MSNPLSQFPENKAPSNMPSIINPLAVIEYYRLTSIGSFGNGTMGSKSKAIVKSSRTIQVEARSL
jgi:hypothetical protein